MANGSEDRRPVPADFQAVIESIEMLSPRYRAAFTPQPKSIAARDVKTRVGRHAIELAATGLSLSIEHLDVWRRLVVDAHLAPPFTYLTLVRTSIEGAVLARWLLDPHLTRDERRARGLGAQWVDYDERRKFEADAGIGPGPPGKPAVKRLHDVEAKARRLNLTLQRPPARTDLFRMFVLANTRGKPLGSVIYRLLSAPAHGHQWALSMHAVPDVLGDQPKSAGRIGRVTINYMTATLATELAVAALSDALADLEVYTRPAVCGS